MKLGSYSILRSQIVRKIVHILFSLMLLIPVMPYYRQLLRNLMIGVDPTLVAYIVLTFGAAFMNSIQIRIPNIRDIFFKFFRDLRKRSLLRLEAVTKSLGMQGLPRGLEELDRVFSKAEENLNTLIAELERDYEKKYGYICITFALLSVLLSYILFQDYVVYGILALAIVDSISAIVTSFTSSMPRIFKHTIVSIPITFSVFSTVLILLTSDILKSIIIALGSVVIEVLSPEDNLTLPLFSSTIAYIVKAPLLIPL